MAIDLKKSWGTVLEKPIATGVSISTEGLLLCRSVEAGVEKVRPCAAAGSEVVVGFSMANNEQVATETVIENVTIAASGAYTAQLSHTNLVGSGATVEMRLYDTVAGADIATQVATAGAIDGATKWFVDPATGIVTVHSSLASRVMTAYYRFNLTVVQSVQLFGSPNVNNTAINALGQIGVYSGHGQIFTKQYDMGKDYSVAAPALATGAAGMITIGGGGTSITGMMRVIKAPTASDMSLGLEFLIA